MLNNSVGTALGIAYFIRQQSNAVFFEKTDVGIRNLLSRIGILNDNMGYVQSWTQFVLLSMHAEEGGGEEKKKEKMFHGNCCWVYVSYRFILVCLDGAVMWCVMFVGGG